MAFLWLVREQIFFLLDITITVFYNEPLFLQLKIFIKNIHDAIFGLVFPIVLTCPSSFLATNVFASKPL